MTVWPSGLRRWLKAPVCKGVGSNPTAVTLAVQSSCLVHPIDLPLLEELLWGLRDLNAKCRGAAGRESPGKGPS